ncbi:MAG TPA: hypothetical protein VJ864_13430 [Candidatus Binatia bacterium]|nr:hypothetical protein [Candidatus Binatia bacterium]
MPDSRHFFLFALLRNAVPPTPERAAQLAAANRAMFERPTALGGKRYPLLCLKVLLWRLCRLM